MIATSNAILQPTKPPYRTAEQVLQYRHPVLVRRFEEKLGISSERAECLFEDMLRFLYLCSVSEEPISPNEVLDYAWHEFILFTWDYAEFCQNYLGEFVHHRPRHPDDPPKKGEGGRRALFLAHQAFGESLSENWSYPPLHLESAGPCDNCGCNSTCTDG